MSEGFKVYLSAKSWFFKKYKSGILHGNKMKIVAELFSDKREGCLNKFLPASKNFCLVVE